MQSKIRVASFSIKIYMNSSKREEAWSRDRYSAWLHYFKALDIASKLSEGCMPAGRLKADTKALLISKYFLTNISTFRFFQSLEVLLVG
jgi:hypothetical protein